MEQKQKNTEGELEAPSTKKGAQIPFRTYGRGNGYWVKTATLSEIIVLIVPWAALKMYAPRYEQRNAAITENWEPWGALSCRGDFIFISLFFFAFSVGGIGLLDHWAQAFMLRLYAKSFYIFASFHLTSRYFVTGSFFGELRSLVSESGSIECNLWLAGNVTKGKR